MSVPTRATVFETVQIGIEEEHGEAAETSQKFSGMEFRWQPDAQSNEYRPQGMKYSTDVIPNTEHWTAQVSGVPTYNELGYALSSAVSRPVTDQPDDSGSPTVYEHVFTPAVEEPDDPNTFTFQCGSQAVRAHQFVYGIFTGFQLQGSRSEVTIGGGVMARELEDDVEMDEGATRIPLRSIAPGHFDVWVAADPQDLGDSESRHLELIRYNFDLSGRYQPVYFVRSDIYSFTQHVEVPPTTSLTLMAEANETTMEWLNDYREQNLLYVRFEANGQPIDEEYNHMFRLDMAVRPSMPQSFEDADGVYAFGFNFLPVDEGGTSPALAGPFEFTLRNGVESYDPPVSP